ncbi:MAG: hypothetical protein JW857_03890 [Bacteroidales bacterium]|nr:hypothetical protein [Bacteroidales bacterium]
MITWPIFVAFFLAIIAVYFSVKHDDEKELNEGKEKNKNEKEPQEDRTKNLQENDESKA